MFGPQDGLIVLLRLSSLAGTFGALLLLLGFPSRLLKFLVAKALFTVIGEKSPSISLIDAEYYDLWKLGFLISESCETEVAG